MNDPKRVPGSSPLNVEQQAEMFARFGKPYTIVASHPHGFSNRRARRRAAKGGGA